MEARGTALLTNEIPAPRAVTAIVSREEIAGALQDPDRSPELYLDINHGEEQSTVGISWSYGELESLFERSSGDTVTLTFDRDELQSLFDDVEAHGFREKALIFTVAVAGAIGSGATIANAAPTIERGADGAASIATVQALATDSIATTGGITSNVHTPGLQTGDGGSTTSAASVTSDSMSSAAAIKLATEPQAAVADSGAVSNVHTPGLQTGDEAFTAPTAAHVSAARSTAADDGVLSNVHRPGLQIGPQESTGVTPSVQVSAGSSSGEFLGIDSRDATDALIAGGVLLAIAGATFAGGRRPGAARPA